MSSASLDWRFPGDVIEVDCEIEGGQPMGTASKAV